MSNIKSGSQFLLSSIQSLAESVKRLGKEPDTESLALYLYAVLVYLQDSHLSVQGLVKQELAKQKKPDKPAPKVSPKVVKKVEPKKPVSKPAVKKPAPKPVVKKVVAPVAKKPVVTTNPKFPKNWGKF